MRGLCRMTTTPHAKAEVAPRNILATLVLVAAFVLLLGYTAHAQGYDSPTVNQWVSNAVVIIRGLFNLLSSILSQVIAFIAASYNTVHMNP